MKDLILDSYEAGTELRLKTPDAYSMSSAVALLHFFEDKMGAEVKNTGWKDGFELKVGVGVPIRIGDVSATLVSDGPEIIISRTSGRKSEFDELCQAIIGVSNGAQQ